MNVIVGLGGRQLAEDGRFTVIALILRRVVASKSKMFGRVLVACGNVIAQQTAREHLSYWYSTR